MHDFASIPWAIILQVQKNGSKCHPLGGIVDTVLMLSIEHIHRHSNCIPSVPLASPQVSFPRNQILITALWHSRSSNHQWCKANLGICIVKLYKKKFSSPFNWLLHLYFFSTFSISHFHSDCILWISSLFVHAFWLPASPLSDFLSVMNLMKCVKKSLDFVTYFHWCYARHYLQPSFIQKMKHYAHEYISAICYSFSLISSELQTLNVIFFLLWFLDMARIGKFLQFTRLHFLEGRCW